MNFFTHRETQPDSLWMRDFVVKSSMQESKQWETRLENICEGVLAAIVIVEKIQAVK